MDVFNIAIVSLIVLASFIIIDGLVGASIKCWSAITPSALIVNELQSDLIPSEIPKLELPVVTNEIQEVELPVVTNEIQEVELPVTEAIAPSTAKPLTYAQQVKARCSQVFNYEIATKRDIKHALINKSDLSFMEAVNLERSGKDFYETVDAYLDLIVKQRSA